ncbi:hypothetical protein AB4084_28760, partial [Lysobacter sp. 2RAB21]
MDQPPAAIDSGFGRVALAAFTGEFERGRGLEGREVEIGGIGRDGIDGFGRVRGSGLEPGVGRFDQWIRQRPESRRRWDCGVSWSTSGRAALAGDEPGRRQAAPGNNEVRRIRRRTGPDSAGQTLLGQRRHLAHVGLAGQLGL